MLKHSLLLSLLLLLQLHSYAQQNKEEFPLVKIPNLPENFYLTKLSNGLEVLVIEDKTVPLATIELVVKNGAFVQTPDLEGLAHLYEHMFFKANRDYPNQEAFLERINELGIVFNGTTSEERVNYFITLGKSKLNDGLQFMNSATRYPKFLAEEMKKENVVVAGEFQRNESNPVFYLYRDLNSRLWGNDYSRKNTIGRYEVILNATPEIMTDIKNRYYYPNNSMLVVAGDVEHLDVFSQVKNIYGDWKPSGFDIFKKYPIPEFQPIKYNQNYVTYNDNTRIPFVMMGWQGPDTRNDIQSTYAADVFFTILSQQSSKLQKALIESGLAYQVSTGYQTQRYTGPINVVLVPNPQTIKEAMDELQKQIGMWSNPDYFTDEQMQAAKDMLEIQDQYGKESVSNYIHTVTYWWASASLDYYANYINNIQKVTRKDISTFISKYIAAKPHVTGMLTSQQISSMIKLDEIFKETRDIDSLTILAAGNIDVALNEAAKQTVSDLAYLLKQNPLKNVKVNVYATKSKVAEQRAEAVKKALEEAGIPAEKLTITTHVIKVKAASPEELKNLNKINFSF